MFLKGLLQKTFLRRGREVTDTYRSTPRFLLAPQTCFAREISATKNYQVELMCGPDNEQEQTGRERARGYRQASQLCASSSVRNCLHPWLLAHLPIVDDHKPDFWTSFSNSTKAKPFD
jgi:hypothetical protein